MTGWEALRTLQLIRGITHVVQVGTPTYSGMKAGGTVWETIAAFNVERAADDYATKYTKATGRTYRVKPLEGWES